MKKQAVRIASTLFFTFIFFGCQNNPKMTEWTKLPAPISAQIRSFAESADGTYYAGTSELYKSGDEGRTWELMNFKNMPLEIMVTNNGSLLVGTYRGGIFRSADQGETWTNVGFRSNIYIFKIIQTDEGEIFASATFRDESKEENSGAGVFISLDDGLTWEQTSLTEDNIKGVFNPKEGIIFATRQGENHVYRSIDDGKTWDPKIEGLPDSIPISEMVELNGKLFASIGDPQDAAGTMGGGIYKSTDNGLNWKRSDQGIDQNTKVSDLVVLNETIYASTGFFSSVGERGVFKSEDQGDTWKPSGLNDLHLRLIHKASNQELIVGTNVSSIFISSDQGLNWMQTGKEIENWSVFQLIENDKYLFASGESGIWRAALPVKEWEQIRKGMGSLLKLSNGNILMAENGVILKSEDNGSDWVSIADLKSRMVFLYEIDTELIIACPEGDGVYFSSNNGMDWTQYQMGEFEDNAFRGAIKTPNGALLVGSYKGTLRSTDQGKTWQNTNEDYWAWSFVKIDHVIYAGGYAQGIRRSTDDGLTWTDFNIGMREGEDYLTVPFLYVSSDNSILCGTLGEGVYRLESGKSTWTEYSTGLKSLVNFGIIEGKKGNLYTTSEKGVFMRNY